MSEKSKKIAYAASAIAEILLLAVFYDIFWGYYRAALGEDLFLFRGKYILLGVYAIIAFMVFRACDSFSFDKLKLFDISVSQCFSVLTVNAVSWLQICLIANGVVTPVPLLILTALDFVFCVVWSMLWIMFFRENGGIENALLIYGSDNAFDLRNKMDRKDNSFSITETISSGDGYAEIIKAVDMHGTVIINDIPAVLRNDILKYCFARGKSVYIAPKISDIMIRGAEDVNTFDTPLIHIRNEGPGITEAFLKRLSDILLTVIALIPASVVMLVIAAAIRIEDGGPVFYRQKRLTINDREFDILKFRSMIVNAEAVTGAVLASENDPRITRVGRFLRSCRLDELPQLFNILKGDMSIVGPRPERAEIAQELIKAMPEFAFRTKVKGGLTGYAQVYGKYNTNSYDKLRLDLMYIENYSLLLDLKIILMTPQVLLRKEAAEGISIEKEIRKED